LVAGAGRTHVVRFVLPFGESGDDAGEADSGVGMKQMWISWRVLPV